MLREPSSHRNAVNTFDLCYWTPLSCPCACAFCPSSLPSRTCLVCLQASALLLALCFRSFPSFRRGPRHLRGVCTCTGLARHGEVGSREFAALGGPLEARSPLAAASHREVRCAVEPPHDAPAADEVGTMLPSPRDACSSAARTALRCRRRSQRPRLLLHPVSHCHPRPGCRAFPAGLGKRALLGKAVPIGADRAGRRCCRAREQLSLLFCFSRTCC